MKQFHANGPILACLIALASLSVGINQARAISIVDSSFGSEFHTQGSSSELQGIGTIGNCTAAPIGPTLIVTAAHCLSTAISTRGFLSSQLGGAVWGTAYAYPSYDFARGIQPNDIAVLVLDNPLPPAHPVFTPYTGAPVFGSTVVLGGYGIEGTGGTGAWIGPKDTGTYALPAAVRASVGDPLFAYNTLDSWGELQNTLSFDFDSPDTSAPLGNPFGSTVPVARTETTKEGPRTFYYEGVSTFGDSGGPLLYNPYLAAEFSTKPDYQVFQKLVPDEFFLIGVSSFVTDASFYWGTRRCDFPWNLNPSCEVPVHYRDNRWGSYGDTSTYTWVAPYLDWLSGFGAIGAASFLVPGGLIDVPVEMIEPLEFASLEPPSILQTPGTIDEPPTLVLIAMAALLMGWRVSNSPSLSNKQSSRPANTCG